MKCFIYDKSNWYSVWVAMRMRTEFDAFSLKREKTDERWWPSKGTSHITVASLLTTSTGTRVALLCELCPLCGLVELLGATNWHYSTSILHSGKNHLPGRSSLLVRVIFIRSLNCLVHLGGSSWWSVPYCTDPPFSILNVLVVEGGRRSDGIVVLKSWSRGEN